MRVAKGKITKIRDSIIIPILDEIVRATDKEKRPFYHEWISGIEYNYRGKNSIENDFAVLAHFYSYNIRHKFKSGMSKESLIRELEFFLIF